VKIDANKTREPISKYVYGQFIEHLGRCIYGGIWAEMLEDRKFFYEITGDAPGWSAITPGNSSYQGEGISYEIVTASPWQTIGAKGTITMVREGAYVGEHTPEVKSADDGSPRGICQDRLGLIKGREYTGRVILAGDPEAAPIEVSLVWGEREKDRDTLTINELASEFVKVPLKFKAGASTDNGRLEIVGRGKGAFRIGTVSLMPADNVHGMRADTLKLLKELDSPVYRWPGGNFVSGYNWKDGIGEPDRRPPRKNPAWTGVEHNDFGIHEFMTFCSELNTEPFIAVNTGLGDATSAAEEVEYFNGAPGTPMGKIRAANGHPEPFNAKWWAVGNEMYGNWQLGHMPLEQYAKKHNFVADAMRQIDPSIRLIAVGLVGKWSKQMLTECADHMDLISEHLYLQDKEAVPEHVAQMPDRIRRIVNAHRGYRTKLDTLNGKDIRIAMDEWNYWYGRFVYGELGVRYYLKDALGIAAGLHEFFRNTDMVFMANYAQTVNVIGCIKTTKTHAAFATTGLALKLYRNQFGVIPVEVTGAPEPLDIEAAWTEDRKALTLGVVNPTGEAVELKLDVTGAALTGGGRLWTVAGDDPMAYNEPGKASKVQIEETSISGASDTIQVPPLSISLYSLAVQ
jgi:alpha-N-arabinofuranosidase